MRTLLVLGMVLLTIGCGTRRNPAFCCINEEDCQNVGLPVGSSCEDGFRCRANMCVFETCESSAQCADDAPYCIAGDGICVMQCADDAQCPGFGQSNDQAFCSGGNCVTCKTSADCSPDAPICDAGECRACAAHDECATSVCDDGMCAPASDIAYADPSASTGSDCSQGSPCALTKALSIAPSRKFIRLAAGTYTNPPALMISGTRHVIGDASRPTIKSDGTAGPVLAIGLGSTVTLERLEVLGGTGTMSPNGGDGIVCGDASSANASLRVRDVVIRQNQRYGLRANGCMLHVTKSRFERNAAFAVDTQDTAVTFDGNVVIGNGTGSATVKGGIQLDGGIVSVTNNIVARNIGFGIDVYADPAIATVEFNTIVDNGTGLQMQTVDPLVSSAANNLIARNSTVNVMCSSDCSTTGSLIVGSDITALRFVSPDVAPYDYHVMDGSSALGVSAGSTTVNVDIDGDARPMSAADVGADERP